MATALSRPRAACRCSRLVRSVARSPALSIIGAKATSPKTLRKKATSKACISVVASRTMPFIDDEPKAERHIQKMPTPGLAWAGPATAIRSSPGPRP